MHILKRVVVISVVTLISFVFASEINIGYVELSSVSSFQPMKQIIAPLIEHNISIITPVSELIEEHHTRQTLQENLTFLKEQHTRFQKGDYAVKEQGQSQVLHESDEYHFSTFTSVIPHKNLQTRAALMLPEIANYILEKEKLDAMVISLVEQVDQLLRYRLILYSKTLGYIPIYDNIKSHVERHTLVQEALEQLLVLGEITHLRVIHTQSDIPSYDIQHDNQDILVIQNLAIVPSQDLTLTLSSFGYDSQDILLKKGEHSVVIDLATQKPQSVLITSYAQDVAVQLFDEKSPCTLPYLIQGRTLPLAFDLVDTHTQVEVDRNTHEVHLTFDVPWINPQLVLQSQTSFYNSFGRTLLLGALGITAQSLLHSLDLSEEQAVIMSSVGYLLGGITALSTFETVGRLFAYYHKTKYSSLNHYSVR
ncbi:MAG: hypothetical protein WCY81_00215 [Sphaerochaetaceae bacterium]